MREAYERTIASTLPTSLILPSGLIGGFVASLEKLSGALPPKRPSRSGWRDENLP
jgi:hypothetical protein